MIRWTAGVFTLALAIGNVAPQIAGAADQTAFSKRVEAAVSGFSGTASVVVSDPVSGYRYSTGASRIMPAASLYKLAVMVEAYRRVAEGTLSLGDIITIADEDLEEDGYYTPAGTDLTVQDAIERMITVSDNSPARALTRTLDAHRINATMQTLGFKDTRINTVLPDEEQTTPFNTTTARDVAGLFEGLSRGTLVGPSWSAQMLGVLGRQQINDRLPAGLPDGLGATIAHKTGDLDSVSHDAGLITGPMGQRVVVMLTTGASSPDDVVTLAEQLAAIACQAPLDGFAARFDRVPGALKVRPGAFARWETQVRNASSFPWGPTTYLVERLRTSSSVRDLGQVPLPPVGPGGSLPLVINVAAPSDPGTYVVEVEVIDSQLGGSGNVLPIVLTVLAGADVPTSVIPAQGTPGSTVVAARP